MSSFTVSGPAESIEIPVNEYKEPRPLTAYAKSKHAGEEIVLSYKGKIPFTVVRAPAVFGPRDTAIYSIFKAAKFGLGTLIGFDKKYLTLIYGIDLAKGTILAGESEQAIGEKYFITDNTIYNWDELIELIKIALGKKFVLKLKIPDKLVLALGATSEFFGRFSSKPPIFNYDKAIDFTQKYWICSSKKAEDELGFRCEYTIPEALNLTVEWYRKNGWL